MHLVNSKLNHALVHPGSLLQPLDEQLFDIGNDLIAKDLGFF